MKKDRYFIVFYTANFYPTGFVTGFIDFITNNSEYLNRNNIINNILQENLKFSNVVITNIIELNKNDFQNWRT